MSDQDEKGTIPSKEGSATGSPAAESPKVEETIPPEEKKISEDSANQEHDWKKRFDGVNQANERLTKDYSQLIDSNVKLVEKNPSVLEDLAETNPKLADEVSTKLYGKNYQNYRAQKDLEEMKGDDPEGYKQEVRLRTLEEREAKRVEQARIDFLKSKGISDNEFDPSFKKVQEQVELLNSKFVEEHPDRAWEIAYSIAFPSKGATAEDLAKAAELASNTNKKGGMSAAIDHRQASLNPAAQAFRDKMSELTGK